MLQLIKAPDLRVLDAAILRIQSGWNVYSCCALTSAAGTFHNTRTYDICIYAQQYARWAHRKRNWQWCRRFWDRDAASPENRHLRVRALQEFKAACIAAAQAKGKP